MVLISLFLCWPYRWRPVALAVVAPQGRSHARLQAVRARLDAGGSAHAYAARPQRRRPVAADATAAAASSGGREPGRGSGRSHRIARVRFVGAQHICFI